VIESHSLDCWQHALPKFVLVLFLTSCG
jgi:hypothetical protein